MLHPISATVFQQSRESRVPAGGPPACTPRDPERALYPAPALSQLQFASSTENPGSQRGTLLSATPEILKGSCTCLWLCQTHQQTCLPRHQAGDTPICNPGGLESTLCSATVREWYCWTKELVEDTLSTPEELLKVPCTQFQPLLAAVRKLCCQHRDQGRDTHIDTLGHPETSLYSAPAPAAMNRDTSRPSQACVTPIHASSARPADFSLGCGA